MSKRVKWLALASIGGLMAGTLEARAQATAPAGRNIIRFDGLSVLGANAEHNLFANRGLLVPVLVSYERRLGPAWSVGAEALLNGGTPDTRRNGGSFSVRYYLRRDATLHGLYLTPAVGYRRVLYTDDDFGTTRGYRTGGGAFVGWQAPFRRGASRGLLLDVAAGAWGWQPAGADVAEHPQYYQNSRIDAGRRGAWVDFRGGIGYQF